MKAFKGDQFEQNICFIVIPRSKQMNEINYAYFINR